MLRTGLRVLALLTVLCLGLADARATGQPVRVEVIRDRNGWSATYHLPAGDRWLFEHSALDRASEQPWRQQSWTVVTPGVSLRRIGKHDMLVASSGRMPRRVHVRFRPFNRSLIGDNDPALVLSDGTTALFTGQFAILPARPLPEVEAAGDDIESATLGTVRTQTAFLARVGEVQLSGRRGRRLTSEERDTYAVFSVPEGGSNPSSTALIDPALPNWLRQELRPLLDRFLTHYRVQLGPPDVPLPILIAQWSGPTPSISGMGGSVLKNVVVMNFEGDGLLAPNPRIRGRARLFLAHEAVHFWLGQQLRVGDPRDRWITEGAADLMAARTIASLFPDFDASARLADLSRECAILLRSGGVYALTAQGKHRAPYACGTVLALMAETASGGDFNAFARGLLSAARSNNRSVVTADDWLTLLQSLPDGERLSPIARQLLIRENAADADAVQDLLVNAGLAADTLPR